jgi:4-amino-4-deoxy-L-arabinose transferase-like glycosyltransferase
MKRATGHHLCVAAILGVAAAVRYWGIGFGLPQVWARPDEDALIVPALRALQGELNPHWFHYPSLYMYLLSVVYFAYFAWERAAGFVTAPPDLFEVFRVAPDVFYLLNRCLAAAFGTLTVFAVYRIGRQLFTTVAATVGALLLALSPLHARDSHFGVADVPATGMAVLSLLAIVRWSAAPSPARLALAGLSCGLAASTKYNVALILIPAVVAIAQQSYARRLEGQPVISRFARDLGLLVSCSVLAFAAGTPYAVLDYPAFRTGVQEVAGHIRAGHGLDLGIGWLYHVRVTLPSGLGWPVFAAALLGAVWMTVAQPRAASLVLSFPIAYYLAAGGTPLVFFRYMMPVLPFLCLAAGFFVERAHAVFAMRPAFSGRAAHACTTALVVLMIASPAMDVIRLDRLLRQKDSRAVAAEWLVRRFPPGTSLYQTGAFYGHVGYRPPDRYRAATRLPDGGFAVDGRRLDAPPDLVIVQSSPVTWYTGDSLLAGPVLQQQYVEVAQFRSYDPARTAAHVYDLLDAFYLPLRGFDGVERPGPNITIYRRR